jgi:two-component system response regulator
MTIMINQKTILLVEDNPDDQTLTLRALQRNNVLNRVDVAQDGAEALDYLFGQTASPAWDPSYLPEMVLLDLKLPKVDGMEVLQQIRSNTRTRLLPVVVLTSSSEEEDILRAYNLGANSYVRKPVNFDQFVEAVRQLGTYWLVLNQPVPRSSLR